MYCQLYEYENPIRKWKHTPLIPHYSWSECEFRYTHTPSTQSDDWRRDMISFQRAKKQNAPAAASGLLNYIFVPDEKGPPCSNGTDRVVATWPEGRSQRGPPLVDHSQCLEIRWVAQLRPRQWRRRWARDEPRGGACSVGAVDAPATHIHTWNSIEVKNRNKRPLPPIVNE